MKTAIAILAAAILTGCATSRPWENAQIGCLEYANAACHAAAENGYLSGVVTCTPRGAMSRHAVTWIIEDGKTLYYDAAFRRYRTQRELGVTHSITDGPSRGSFDLIPLMHAKKGKQ
jgi:hypothetical protein